MAPLSQPFALLAALLAHTLPRAAPQQCQWLSNTGGTFDLSPLKVTSKDSMSYHIRDGDIPCTPEVEPTYSYIWNFCSVVTDASFPSSLCKGFQQQTAIQYLNRTDGYRECNIIGRYDSLNDQNEFSLIDAKDPSKGVSMKYSEGDKCVNTDVYRSATIDVHCDNSKATILSALEPSLCQYHMVMKSYYGCPKECPVTSEGLCSSHGHCAYDSNNRKPYCYCNEGYSGDACNQQSGSSGSGSSYAVQVGLLVALVVITVLLIGVVGVMVVRITRYRKEQLDYSVLSTTHNVEMIDVNF